MTNLNFSLSLAAGVTLFLCGAASGETLYVTAARMIDPAAGRVIDAPALIIEDGVVTASGSAASLTAPDGARAINLSGKTILPGLIDMHTHMTGDPTKGGGYSALAYAPERAVIWAVVNAERTLMAGFYDRPEHRL